MDDVQNNILIVVYHCKHIRGSFTLKYVLMQESNIAHAFGYMAGIPLYRWLYGMDRSEGLDPGKVRLLFTFD
jgi:hypothetical protein